ncbi:hypothetical protein AUC60_01200 [Pseudomonas caspiana]|uniref:Uncharacterized protein n=1 Tax=Pseudomonas caspiana TaxID=1451454 RepID=A0A1Y3PG24_9PSED|nr:hypothetical protein AUC60_01200 [Pseudomonas caspiana]
MARKGGAVPGIVGGIVYRFDVGETGEVHKACAKNRCADGGGQALASGGCSAGGMAGCTDRHGASL